MECRPSARCQVVACLVLEEGVVMEQEAVVEAGKEVTWVGVVGMEPELEAEVGTDWLVGRIEVGALA